MLLYVGVAGGYYSDVLIVRAHWMGIEALNPISVSCCLYHPFNLRPLPKNGCHFEMKLMVLFLTLSHAITQ